MNWRSNSRTPNIVYSAQSGPMTLRVTRYSQGEWDWRVEYQYGGTDEILVGYSRKSADTREEANQQAKDAMLAILAEEEAKISKALQELKELGI